MYLKRLELNGFKSFAKKTVLEFDSPVTSIVGPNGSGKSNVVEAIRFVLGEQSMKSLRGKGGSDLIFKGSKNLSALSKASVTIVFDNHKKVFSFSGTGANVALDFDEIAISREVVADGGNRYLINGTEVRLKDILDMLSSVNIGSSGHHIISQGEADRVLSASSKDRRSMIEDALGLKVYQYKIRESERKLEKTSLNMKEVNSLRREIAPHITFLKKQVEKIEKAQELRSDLKALYHEYFSKESGYVKLERERLGKVKHSHQEELKKLEHELARHEEGKGADAAAQEHARSLSILEDERKLINPLRDELSRKLGRIEGSIEALERQSNAKKSASEEDRIVLLSEIEMFSTDIDSLIDEAFSAESMTEINKILLSIRATLREFIMDRKSVHAHAEAMPGTSEEKESLVRMQGEITAKLHELDAQAEKLEQSIAEKRTIEMARVAAVREMEKSFYELKTAHANTLSKMEMIALEEEALSKIQVELHEEIQQATVLVDRETAQYSEDYISPETDLHALRREQEDLKKKIERIKIKLEDSGAIGGGDVLKEYEESTTRDQFLSRELDDLLKSSNELRSLIRDLKETLDAEFKGGIEKINKQFQEFFSLMFGGGSAFLSVVVEHRRAARGGEDDEEVVSDMDEENLAFERGIEINVSLPHKKVKDLHMLSGGERSLTSIALLFAMSQVNPPPFLVLDETDAALDEANSRKYGNMIESLSKYSQLIVVTHNRETMSRANVLYGVTIGADGGSKLLSIKFEEAVQIAK